MNLFTFSQPVLQPPRDRQVVSFRRTLAPPAVNPAKEIDTQARVSGSSKSLTNHIGDQTQYGEKT
ncbi:hypothetical protein [Sphingobium vermicomposti]|uniref:hypothetical protein n=1 Tax=Sphingobium vermicomposti TaxID=529005 RepID=UPI001420BFEC|nr:hypothetical protein [Sphingobium vermicomposti]